MEWVYSACVTVLLSLDAYVQYNCHCHSHYEVYAVITDQSPDTSEYGSEQTDTSYVTFAGRAISGLSIQITVGTGVSGELTLDDNQQVDYDNRDVRLGANYYFFVRLYSSQEVPVHV